MIVSCGEALIDFVPAATATGEAAYVARAGGSPFNVAITIGRLGVGAGFLGGVSTDFFGDSLIVALDASAVDTRYAARTDRPTALAFVDLSSAQPRYTFYDRDAAHRCWVPVELAADVMLLHFGSLALVDGPAADGLGALMAREHGRRMLTLDPNIRPSVAGDHEEAYRARLDAMLRLADLIKISAEDLTWLEPGADPAAVALRWVAAGASLVVVTAGAGGATAFTPLHAPFHASARAVDVVDTVGAGDSFMGALLAGLTTCGVTTIDALAALDAHTLADVMTFATDVSAITCSRAGADPPRRDEVRLPGPRAGRKEDR